MGESDELFILLFGGWKTEWKLRRPLYFAYISFHLLRTNIVKGCYHGPHYKFPIFSCLLQLCKRLVLVVTVTILIFYDYNDKISLWVIVFFFMERTKKMLRFSVSSNLHRSSQHLFLNEPKWEVKIEPGTFRA